MGLWRARKLSHEQCIDHLQESRCFNASGLVEQVRYAQQEEKRKTAEEQMRKLHAMLRLMLRPFIEHDMVVEWKKQYGAANYGVEHRFKSLLLKGVTRKGKTLFAENIFGEEQTFSVQ